MRGMPSLRRERQAEAERRTRRCIACSRSASAKAQALPQGSPRRAHPATAGAAVPSRLPEPGVRSFRFSFQPVEKISNRVEVIRIRFPPRKSLHHELRCRSAECPVGEVGQQLPLRFLFAVTRLVNMRSCGLIANDETLL